MLLALVVSGRGLIYSRGAGLRCLKTCSLLYVKRERERVVCACYVAMCVCYACVLLACYMRAMCMTFALCARYVRAMCVCEPCACYMHIMFGLCGYVRATFVPYACYVRAMCMSCACYVRAMWCVRAMCELCVCPNRSLPKTQKNHRNPSRHHGVR